MYFEAFYGGERQIIFEGTGVGGKYVVIMGAGTGGCLTQSGWEAMGAKNMVARDGYVSVGRDSTTDYRVKPCILRWREEVIIY